jgi:hypothetical protein
VNREERGADRTGLLTDLVCFCKYAPFKNTAQKQKPARPIHEHQGHRSNLVTGQGVMPARPWCMHAMNTSYMRRKSGSHVRNTCQAHLLHAPQKRLTCAEHMSSAPPTCTAKAAHMCGTHVKRTSCMCRKNSSHLLPAWMAPRKDCVNRYVCWPRHVAWLRSCERDSHERASVPPSLAAPMYLARSLCTNSRRSQKPITRLMHGTNL